MRELLPSGDVISRLPDGSVRLVRAVEPPASMVRYPLARPNYDVLEITAVMDALRDGQTTCGPRVAHFEQRFAEYVGRSGAVMVNSGSSADMLVAFGLGPPEYGDEILVPAITWPTQVWACLVAGYRVRLVDVDPFTLQIDPTDVVRKLSDRTRAVFVAHILGNVGNMDTLADAINGTPLIEDCCEAMGSRWRGKHVGTFGHAAAFSFFFSHVMSTMEGGMVVCDGPEAVDGYRRLRNHGWDRSNPRYPYRFPSWGFNVRPTELSGAFGVVQLDRLNAFRQARACNYERLRDATSVAHLQHVVVPSGADPCWHGFPLMVGPNAPFTRDELCAFMTTRGIESRPIVVGNLANQPAVANDSRVVCDALPGAQAIDERGLYIGLHSTLDPEGACLVGETVRDFLAGQSA